ncbi:MAG: hypothetical protein QOD67_4581 [Caballeronia sp.]|jgi:hypothetical protein|nr:hypothetical protein [Caballeronia sp.]
MGVDTREWLSFVAIGTAAIVLQARQHSLDESLAVGLCDRCIKVFGFNS